MGILRPKNPTTDAMTVPSPTPSFLRSALASLCGFLGACVLLGCCLLALGAVSTLVGAGGEVPEGAILTVDLSQPISDRGQADTSLSGILEGVLAPLVLARVAQGIAAAGEDERISGLLLHGVARGRSWAQLATLRAAVEEFSASGKPVTAWFANWSEPELLLGSAADERWIQPLGTVALNGLAAEMMFFGEGLTELGVEMQVIKVGRYKSAVDPYLRDSMSEADREQWQRLLDGLFERFAQGTASGLDLDAGTLAEIAQEGNYLSSERATTLGLVSGELHFTALLDELHERTGAEAGDPFTQVSLATWLEAEDPLDTEDGADENTVAVLYAEGAIVDGESAKAVGGDSLARQIRALAADDEVKAVVMRVNSPGGSASASEVILEELRRLQETKPLVVSMGGLAASGGYWISCLADHIVAQPETLTGSIGVFGLLPSVGGLLDKLGVHVTTVSTAPHADAESMFRTRTADELEHFQAFVDQIYEDFISRVSRGRSLSRERVHEIGQGRVWLGMDALELGLVDSLGGLDQAVAQAALLAELDGFTVRHELDRRDAVEQFLEGLLEDEGDELVRNTPLSPAMDLWKRVKGLDRLTRSGGIQARLPLEFSIR